MEGFPNLDDTAQPTAVAKGRHAALQQTPLIGASFMMTQVPGRSAHACSLQPPATRKTLGFCLQAHSDWPDGTRQV